MRHGVSLGVLGCPGGNQTDPPMNTRYLQMPNMDSGAISAHVKLS